MKYINTLTNSFVLGEKDDNGRILEQFGFPKGGLTYLIKGVNVKFYLAEDYFYKNVIWSADAPLMIDGVLISVDNLPIALKKIFHQEAEEIAIDTEFDTESFNAIANAPVSVRFNEIEVSQGVISDKVGALSGEVHTKASEADLTAHTADSNIHVTTGEKESWNSKAEISDIPDVSNFIEMSAVTDYTYSKSVIDEKIENVEVDAYTKTESDERFQPIGDYLSGNALNGYATEQWVEDKGYLTEHQDISGKQDVSGMTAYTTTATTDALNDVVTAHTANTDIHVTVNDKQTWNSKIASGDVVNLFGNVVYDSNSKRINFYHESTTGDVLAYIDATAFIKDGMVDEVAIVNGNLVITFNTDSGKEPITIPLTDIFNPANYYTKQEVDTAISAATDDMATKTWVGQQGYLTEHQSLTAYSTTEEVNNAIVEATSGKADNSTVSALNDVVTAHTANTDVHVTSADKNVWNSKSDFSGSYNDLTDKPTIPSVPTDVSAFNNDAGYITNDALNGYATEQWVGQQGYLTEHQDISGKQDVSGMTAYTTTATTDALNGVVTAHTADTTIHVTSAEKSAWNAKSDFSGSYNDLTGKPSIPSTGDIQTQIDSSISGKQDTLSAGTGISIVGNVISATGGGGTTYTAGRGIDITNDTISVSLPISAGTGTNSIAEGDSTEASGDYSHAEGNKAKAQGSSSHAEGRSTIAIGNRSHAEGQSTKATGIHSHAEGNATEANGSSSHAEGQNTIANNKSEHASGQYNVSSSASTTFGDSGNTLFSVGNGTANNARHNAFEIRQNGDIYLTKDGQDVKLQDQLGGGGGNNVVELTQAEYSALTTIDPTTIYVITDAEEINANEYVTKVSNIASGYTDVITPKSSYSYSEAFNDTVYWNAGTYTGSSSSRQIGSAIVYTSQYGSTTIFLTAGISNGVVTANTTNNNQYLTIEVVDGELAVTPNEGYYWRELRDNNRGSHNIKKHYSSGQSKNVIENTIYDVLDTRNEQIEDLRTNMVTDVTASVSDGELRVSEIKTNGSGVSTVILKSSTINYDNGLNVQFSSTTEGQKVLNTGSYSYYDLFNAGYDTTKSYHDLTIVMNSGYTGSHAEPTFSFYFLTSDGTTRSSQLSFAYNVANNSISWLNEGWGTYVTVTDTLSTDYTIKFTANDGYLISFFSSNNGLIGGVDTTRPYEFVTNLITTTSYIHPGQDIIDDLYANKQDTLSAGTGISIVDNVISATGGGGKAIEAGRGIAITTGETADTVSFNLPISAGTGDGALIIASDTYELNNKAIGDYAVSLNGGAWHPNYATGNRSLAEGADTKAFGECCHAEGFNTSAGTNSYPYTSFAHAEGYNTHAAGDYSHAEGTIAKALGTASHAEGYYTIANNNSEHASGKFNVSNTGSTDADKTLFSVGNGTANNARHNAFEIRQNGDIYCSDGANDVKLQDTITATAANTTALGGLKLVKLTQSAYDALTTKDDNTVYFIGDSTNGYTMKIGSANVN